MTLLHKFMGTGSPSAPTYVDDVFSAYTYTGTGASNPIVNGVDLSGKGGLVWTKSRGAVGNNYLIDSVRGIGQSLSSDTTVAQGATTFISSLNSNGYTLSTASGANGSGATYASWTFRKAAKFFDVVTFTAPSSGTTVVNHSLGQTPGLIIVKRTDSTGSWFVYHRSLGATKWLQLESTGAEQTNASMWSSVTSTSITLTVGVEIAASSSCVAYIFAHDTATDGLIQCGSFTSTAGGLIPPVTLGWEPQFLLLKSSGATGNWTVIDSSRGFSDGGTNQALYPNLSNVEAGNNAAKPTATGFDSNGGGGWGASVAGIYLAIRRPNKPPTTGTQVYNAIARTGTGAAATVTGVGFAPDLVIHPKRNIAGFQPVWRDRLRGNLATIDTSSTNAEDSTSTASILSFNMDGMSLGADNVGNYSGTVNRSAGGDTYINWFFKRAPQVFDEVCYTGTGANRTVTHNLGVAPELMIVKSRSAIANWIVYSGGATDILVLNATTAIQTGQTTAWNSTAPTSSVFSLGTAAAVNTNAATYTTYLFATKAGISKVGSYTGNGGTQTINCGFSTGARFVLIKKTSSTGDWFVWDTVRGIVSGFDPHLSLNTTAAEVSGTTDSIDPDNTGFIVNSQAGYDINATSATYIYLAFA